MGKFVEFDTRGNQKQKSAAEYWADSTTEQVLYGGAKYTGKSFLGCSLILGDALMYPDTHYFIARKELNDLRKFTMPSIYEVFSSWGLDHKQYCTYNGQDNFFKFNNGSMIYLIQAKYLPSDHLYSRFGSIQMTRGWIEEGGEIEERAYQNLFLTIGRWNNRKYGLKKKLLITCNPTKNWMYHDFYRPSKDGVLGDEKKFIQALPTDNKAGNQDYIKSLEGIKDKVTRQRLWLGNWEYDDDENSLISFDSILDLFRNDHVIPNPSDKWLVADIAFKSDRFALGVFHGLTLVDRYIRPKVHAKKILQQITAMRVKHGIPQSRCIVDADGVGGYVQGFMSGVKEFRGNARPVPEQGDTPANYENLKAQCTYKLAEVINEGRMNITCLDDQERSELIEELECIKSRDKDKDGKMKVLRKEEVKKLIGRSPDIADMLMMRMMPLVKKERSVYYDITF